jgi:nitrile hydratase subunit alpha
MVPLLHLGYGLYSLSPFPLRYRSRSYRSRTVREPRKVLESFGTYLPKDVEIQVHDSTADCRFLVLPLRPQGTEDWTAEQLRAIVTRDSMVGVSVLSI